MKSGNYLKMASKAFAAPLIRQVTTRGLAAAPALKELNVSSSVLPNKTVVAALDNGSPVTRVTVAFRAGSRFENGTELGISHVLRSAAGLTTTGSNSFIVARRLAQIGASVTATGDREFVYYTVETTQQHLDEALELLTKIVTKQEFRPWELDDNNPRLKFDIAALTPQVRAVDLLHKAAYRRGLGNSLFISPKKIGKISSESLQHYAAANLVSGRCAVTVVGDSLDKANLIAQSLQLPQGCDSKSDETKYFGGEMRKEMGGDLTHVAVAVQGAPAGTPQALSLAIAAKALGCGPVTKWGCDNSPLGKAIGNVGPFAAAGFNVSYSDSGLFGVVLSVAKDEATSAVKAVTCLLRNAQLSQSNIQAGKNLLKLQVLSDADEGATLSESLAAQGLYTGSIKTPNDLAKVIENIPDGDVLQALSQAGVTKLSMGAAGNLAFLPFVDEL